MIKRGEIIDHRRRLCDGLVIICVDQAKEAFGKAGEVPCGHVGLIAVSVAALLVNGREARLRAVAVEEGTGAIVNRFARNGHVVGVHHTVHKADIDPLRDKARLPFGNALQEAEVAAFAPHKIGIMARYGVIRELLQHFSVAACRKKLKAADPQVRACNARQHRTVLGACFTMDFLPRCDCGQGAGCGDA